MTLYESTVYQSSECSKRESFVSANRKGIIVRTLPHIISSCMLFAPMQSVNHATISHYENVQKAKGGVVVSIHNVNPVLSENLRRLSLMEQMEEDWDGYGGKPFSREAISLFRSIVQGISHHTQILPTNHGGMGMIYRKPDGSYMDFEVFEDRIEFMHIPQMDITLVHEDVFTGEKTQFIQYIDERLVSFFDQA